MLCALMLLCLGTSAFANDEASHTAASRGGVVTSDPISQLGGSPTNWSVSRTEAGCFIMSPRRRDSSRFAIGLHPKLGLGLFAVGLWLATQGPNATERVQIDVHGQELSKAGRMIGGNVLFIALDQAEADLNLHEVRDTGALGLSVRQVWIAHGGSGAKAAIKEYDTTCATGGGAVRGS